MYRKIVIAQTIYYLVTGFWPLLHMESFLGITGYKQDLWLVQQVGLLTLAIAVSLAIATWQNKIDLSLVMLGTLAAVSFAAIDTFYSIKGSISPVYLVDAGIEAVFVFTHIGRIATTDRL